MLHIIIAFDKIQQIQYSVLQVAVASSTADSIRPMQGMSGGLEAMSGEVSNGGKGNQGVSGVSGASDWRRQRAAVSSGGDGEPGSAPGIQVRAGL